MSATKVSNRRLEERTSGLVISPIEAEERSRAWLTWLRAIESFFDLSLHPRRNTSEAKLDLTNELSILRQAAQRALRLLAVGSVRDASGDVLREALGEFAVMCETVERANARVWESLKGAFVCRVWERSAVANSLAIAVHAEEEEVHPRLRAAVRSVAHPWLRDDLRLIFVSLARMLGWQRLIELELEKDRPLKVVLPIFTLIHKEARQLVSFIETRALHSQGLDAHIFDALDASAYAMSMELNKVFTHELIGVAESRDASEIYARVEDATGLLCDCFQQTTVGVAQLFDATINGAELFASYKTRLEQSLCLRRDIWTLSQIIRRLERERHHLATSKLVESLEAFRRGSMRFLMYKDWESLERFIEEVTTARGVSELIPVLHRFSIYLETLFRQVNMRLVLADHPFEPPTETDLLSSDAMARKIFD